MLALQLQESLLSVSAQFEKDRALIEAQKAELHLLKRVLCPEDTAAEGNKTAGRESETAGGESENELARKLLVLGEKYQEERARIAQHEQASPYTDVCGRMLTYADIC